MKQYFIDFYTKHLKSDSCKNKIVDLFFKNDLTDVNVTEQDVLDLLGKIQLKYPNEYCVILISKSKGLRYFLAGPMDLGSESTKLGWD